MAHFQVWAEKSDIPWRAIKPHLNDTLEKARLLWPQTLDALPMDDNHKTQLREHWKSLQKEFQIK